MASRMMTATAMPAKMPPSWAGVRPVGLGLGGEVDFEFAVALGPVTPARSRAMPSVQVVEPSGSAHAVREVVTVIHFGDSVVRMAVGHG